MDDSPWSIEIEIVRVAVPEFEPALQELLREEEGEVSAFEVISRLADWVIGRLHSGEDSEAVERAFEAIERFIDDSSIQFGDALAAEFIEATWHDPKAVEAMRPHTRARLDLSRAAYPSMRE